MDQELLGELPGLESPLDVHRAPSEEGALHVVARNPMTGHEDLVSEVGEVRDGDYCGHQLQPKRRARQATVGPSARRIAGAVHPGMQRRAPSPPKR